MSDGRGSQGLPPPVPRNLAAGTETAQKLRQAMALQQQGQFREAERLYRNVLSEAPGHPEALHMLGLMEAQQGRFEPALALFDRAIAANPNNAAVHYNRGNALRALGRLPEALVSYERALSQRPDHIPAQIHCAAVLYRLGRYDEALASCDRVLAAKPDHLDSIVTRGNVLLELNRANEAMEDYRKALAINPPFGAALYGLGNAQAALKQYADAVASYSKALEAVPGNTDLLNNRGLARTHLGQHDEALTDFRHAIAAEPERPDSYVNRGNILLQHQHYEEALADFERALVLRSDYPEALYGQGRALLERRRFEEAVGALEHLLRVRPDYPFAPGMLLHAKRSACDWKGHNTLVSAIVSGIRANASVASPLAFLAVSDSPKDNADCARILAKSQSLATTAPLWRGERYRHEKIRIAYVSSDFHAHAVAFLMAGVFEHHDRSRFETIAMSYGPDDGGPMRARLRQGFDCFIDVREKSVRDIAREIREREIDIAVDLKGYTGDARPAIFAARAAPIQVNYLGFPGTMGSDCYDYILADRSVIPEDQRAYYNEQVVYLPHSYLPHDRQRAIAPAVPSRASCGLPVNGFVFCCFNASYKIGPETFDCWMRLLRDVAGSVLWLSATPDSAVHNLKREAEARGVSGDRLIFASFTPTNEEHLARLSNADLFLDTLPYNAHTTASDALWAGLPVLTCAGGSFAGRVGASLLNAAGLEELIAPSREAYEALALTLARDPSRLTALKTKLARNHETASLFDTALFARHLEGAYTAMQERHVRGEPSASFTVDPFKAAQ